jgi:SOS-response transcriptional repressor LexA
LELLGDPDKGNFDYLTEKYDFFKELMRMTEYPKEFMSMDIKYTTASKTKIRKLLQSFKLPMKTETIEEFIKKLS